MIIDSIKTYFESCPLIKKGRIQIDFLDKKTAWYTIDIMPCDPVVKRYATGGSLKQFCFVFAGREGYRSDLNRQNAAFYEKLAAWITGENEKGNLPELGTGKTAQRMEVISSGYLYAENVNDARYQMQCRLTYTEL